MTLAEINPLGRLADGSFVALDAHMEMENEARGRHRQLLAELGVGEQETRQAREATPFELAGEAVDAPDHRGVAGNVTEFDGNLGLVIGAGGGSLTLFDAVRAHGRQARELLRDRRQPLGRQGLRAGQAGPAEAGRGQDRRDDVDRLEHARGHRRARRDQGLPGARPTTPPRRSRSSASPARGRRRASRSSRSTASTTPTAACRSTRPRAAPSRRSRAARLWRGRDRMSSILIDADTTFIVQGITGREAVNLTRECLDYGAGAKIVGGVTPGRLGREVHGVPVFDTVAQAVAHHGGPIDGSVVTVPPAFTQGRRLRGDRERHPADRDRHRADPARATSPRWSSSRRCAARASSAPTASASSCRTWSRWAASAARRATPRRPTPLARSA